MEAKLKEKGFYKWFSKYSEDNHHLKGWREYDNYLDEVHLPNELKMCLIQRWLRDVYNIDIFIRPFYDVENGFDKFYTPYIIHFDGNRLNHPSINYKNYSMDNALDFAIKTVIKTII
jgi:hypothetical protein